MVEETREEAAAATADEAETARKTNMRLRLKPNANLAING
jgi:hypothetical protein